MTAVNPPGVLTAAKPEFTAVKPDEEAGRTTAAGEGEGRVAGCLGESIEFCSAIEAWTAGEAVGKAGGAD